MAKIMQTSPNQLSTDEYVFPDKSFDELNIRIESGGTFKVHIRLNNTVSSTQADFFLDSGESLEIEGCEVQDRNAKNVHIISVTGDPKIFWSIQ